MHLFGEASFRPDAEAVAQRAASGSSAPDQSTVARSNCRRERVPAADHRDRRTGRWLPEVICRHVPVELELVEQLRLLDLPRSIIDLVPASTRLNSRPPVAQHRPFSTESTQRAMTASGYAGSPRFCERLAQGDGEGRASLSSIPSGINCFSRRRAALSQITTEWISQRGYELPFGQPCCGIRIVCRQIDRPLLCRKFADCCERRPAHPGIRAGLEICVFRVG